MEILEKISKLSKSIEQADQLVDELIPLLEGLRLKSENKGVKIEELKREIEININKLDEIIKDHNANT
tara:strand:+ start:394 stop:597 length:204 start_codon:yes stop_codon:yes gene_type:complete